MSTSISSFDPSLLLSYYQSQLSAAPAQTAAAGASTNSSSASATSNDNPPWYTPPPAQQEEDAQVLDITDFLDTSNVPLSPTGGADAATEQDNQKLFSIYQAVNNLAYLASMSQRSGTTAGQMEGYNTRFQAGLAQVEDYLNSTAFNNFTLQAAEPSASVTSTVNVPFQTYGYTGKTLVSDASLANPLSGVSTADSFDISVKKGGVTTDVAIDLSQVQGPLTMDNIVGYINQQLQADGFSSRFQRTITQGSEDDPQDAYYGIAINESPSETITLSSANTSPALYLAGTNGSQSSDATLASAVAGTASTSSASGTSGASSTTTPSSTAPSDQQGRLIKLTDLSGAPQSTFVAETSPSTGATTAQASAVDANGDVYVIGNATGDFTNQVNQGSQDVYLSKYDSAGQLQWSKLLGSAGSASGYAIAADPNGGVVITGSTTADLSTTAVADGNTDTLVAKYDADGDQTWVQQLPTLSDNQGNAISVDTSGNIYIGGGVGGDIGLGQKSSGGTDAYLAKLDKDGNIVYEKQSGTSGNDQVSATATSSDGSLFVASVQNGHAIVSKYAGGDATQEPVWQVDLGDLQGGTIGGLAVSGNQVYVSGSSVNANLTANGAANIVTPASGSQDAFVFAMSDNGASATPEQVSYVGTSSSDQGGAVTVGPDGTVYLTGTTRGTFAGQSRSVDNTTNAFVAALNASGNVAWTTQFGGVDGTSSGTGIAIDTQGSSVLDALGLPHGTLDTNQSVDLESQTTLRSGDTFNIDIQGSAARNITITIDSGETLESLADKISGEMAFAGKASVTYGSDGEALKIQVNPGVTATLVSGPADSDALSRLGIAAGTLTAPATAGSSSTSSSSSTAGTSSVYGLGLSGTLDISTSTGAGVANAELSNVLSEIRNIYSKTNTAPSSGTTAATSTNSSPPAYLQAQLANYATALDMLSGSSGSSGVTA